MDFVPTHNWTRRKRDVLCFSHGFARASMRRKKSWIERQDPATWLGFIDLVVLFTKHGASCKKFHLRLIIIDPSATCTTSTCGCESHPSQKKVSRKNGREKLLIRGKWEWHAWTLVWLSALVCRWRNLLCLTGSYDTCNLGHSRAHHMATYHTEQNTTARLHRASACSFLQYLVIEIHFGYAKCSTVLSHMPLGCITSHHVTTRPFSEHSILKPDITTRRAKDVHVIQH